jgi:hypothetical protein
MHASIFLWRPRLFLTAAISILLFAACSFPMFLGTDMVVVDPENGKMVPLKSSTFRQIVVKIDDETSRFSTLTLDEKRQNVLLRTYDTQGNRLSETVVPKFGDSLGGGEDYALSPDASKIVYKKQAELRMLDLATKDDVTILPDAMSKYGRILVRWLSNDCILLVSPLPEGGGDDRLYRISLLDVATGHVTHPYRDVYLDNAPTPGALSPDKTHLVIQDVGRKNGFLSQLFVVDLNSGKDVANIGDGLSAYYGSIAWRPDSKAFAFVENPQGRNTTAIKLFRLGDEVEKPLIDGPKGHVIYGVIWAGDSIGYYSGNPDGGKHGDLVLVDATTGQKLREVGIYINGRLHYLPKARRIVAEVN